jgi:hypothetical protein
VDILLLLMVFGLLVVFAVDTVQKRRVHLCQQVAATRRLP